MRFAILGISPRDEHVLAGPDRLRPVRGVGHPARRRDGATSSTARSTHRGLLAGRARARLRGRPADVRPDRARSATITKDAYDRLTDEMFGMLREQGPWDGVLIANHGAAVSEEFPDMDAAFAEQVRDIVGPDVPSSGSPRHARQRLEGGSSTTTACHDGLADEPASRRASPAAANAPSSLYRTAKGEITPVQWIETPPLVVNIVRQFTGEEPMKTLVADCVAANERPGILDTSVAEGYPYADVEQMGMAWVAIADGDLEAARDAARLDGGARLGASRRAEQARSVGPRGARDWPSALPWAARAWVTSTRYPTTARRCRRRPRPRGRRRPRPASRARSC